MKLWFKSNFEWLSVCSHIFGPQCSFGEFIKNNIRNLTLCRNLGWKKVLNLIIIRVLILNDACAICLYVHVRRGVGREKTISGVSITSRKSEGRIEPTLEWRGCLRSVSDEVRAWLQVTELCNTGYHILTASMPSRTRSMHLKDDRANPNQFPVKSAVLRGRGGSLKHVGLRSSVTCCMRRSRPYLIGWARKKVIGMPFFIYIKNCPFHLKMITMVLGSSQMHSA